MTRVATQNRATALLLAAAVTLSLCVGAGFALGSPAAEASANGKRPNIILIMLDDQAEATFKPQFMPKAFNRIVDGGTRFTNSIVASPSCCPSRASFLSGQYPHNNGVFANRPGYPSFKQKSNTIGTWLQRANYNTAHIGKWLNHYAEAVNNRNQPAPGWDEWFTMTRNAYEGFTISDNGRGRSYNKRDPRDYLTRVLSRRTSSVVRKFSSRKRPFYLQLDHYAPHSEITSTSGRCKGASIPDPVDRNRFRDAVLPQHGLPREQQSFDELDISDKPKFLQRKPLTARDKSQIKRRYRCQLASQVAVDRSIEKLFNQLENLNELKDTVLIFSSDNGFFFGEHRTVKNKGSGYDEAIRVPLAIKVPDRLLSGPQPATLAQPVLNIDLTASILEFADAEPCRSPSNCRTLDGRSLVPILNGDNSGFPADRVVYSEQNRKRFCEPFRVAWDGNSSYIEYHRRVSHGADECGVEPEIEFYDIGSDPLQLDNLFPADRTSPEGQAQARLEAKLQDLAVCSGIEGRDPEPDSGVYCD